MLSINAIAQQQTQEDSTGQSGGKLNILFTDRNAPYGVFSVGQNSDYTHKTALGYVDGYVRKHGNTPFIFPVGHGAFYGPFAAAADRTTGAYYHKNPASSSFPTNLKDKAIGAVSNNEYWDIDGANSTQITISWNKISDLTGFVPHLDQLTVVGWKDGQWTKIPSKVDNFSILEQTSTMETGSITTAHAIVPDGFEIYTIGSLTHSPIAPGDHVFYPNPASKLLKMKSSIAIMDKSMVRVTDVSGRDHTHVVSWTGDDMNVETLPDGIYILTVPGEAAHRIQSKFVVRK